MRAWIVSLCVGACLLGLGVASPARAGRTPTNEQIGQRLLHGVLAPVLEAAEPHRERSLYLREAPGGVDAPNVLVAFGEYFFDRGYEVHLMDAEDELPDDAMLFEFRPRQVWLRFPEKRRDLLSLRAEKTARSARLAFEGKLELVDTGQWLWRGEPEARYHDWIVSREVVPVGEDHPLVATAPRTLDDPNQPATIASSKWRERITVLSLLSSVVLLYFSGSD